MKHFFLVLIFCFPTLHISFAQTYPTVTNERPRIRIPADRFDDIKNLLTNGDNQERIDDLFNDIKEGSSGFSSLMTNGINLSGTQESQWSWSFSSELRAQQVLHLILLHYNLADVDTNGNLGIDKDLQKRRLRFIAEKLNTKIDTFLTNSDFTICDQIKRNEYEGDFRVFARFAPYLIDWGYTALEPSHNYTIREELMQKLWDVSYHFMTFWIYTAVFPDCSNTYYAGGHSIQNHMLNLKLVTSLLNSSEFDADQQNALEVRYRFLIDKIEDEHIPAHKFFMDDNSNGYFDDNEGGSDWTPSYAKLVRRVWTEIFDILKYSSDIDYYPQNYWFNSSIEQDFYYLKPDLGTLHLGDGTQLWQYENDNSIISLFNNYDNSKNRWMMKQYEMGANSRTSAKLGEILLRDWSKGSSNAPATNPASLDWYSQKTGTIVSKSSWGEDATMVTYFSPTTNRNVHQQLNANSFQIFKDGPLFMHAGAYDYYGTDHFRNFYTRTIAHNTITIFDPNQEFVIDGYAYANDGGQRFAYPLLNIDAIEANYNPGIWKNAIINNDFNYSVTDAASAYNPAYPSSNNPNKVTSSVRKFLYEKSTDRLIIVDYIEQPQATTYKTVKFLSHFVNRPIVMGFFGSRPGSIKKYGTSYKKFTIDNNTGRGILKSLYPSNITSTIVGGDDHEHFVFDDDSDTTGTNDEFCYVKGVYKPNKEVNGVGVCDLGGRTEYSKWRLEIRKPQGTYQRKEIFLNTIAIGTNDEGTTSFITDNTSKLISKNNISIALQWDNNIYVFSAKQGGQNNWYHNNNINSLNSGTYTISAFDLESNDTYEVLVDNVVILEADTDTYGYLKVNSMYISGNVSNLKIRRKSSVVIGKLRPSNTIMVAMYPNTLTKGDDLYIEIENIKEERYSLRVFDINGLEVFKKECYGSKQVLTNLQLTPGVYIVKISSENGVSEKKLVVR